MNQALPLTRTFLFCAGLVQLLCLPVAAGSNAESTDSLESSFELDPVIVVASKIPQRLSGIAGQVTIIDAENMQRGMVENLDSLVKYAPGLDIETSGTRFGGSSINIRGISGNRIEIEIDGVPMRDQFAIGAYSNGGRTLVETDRVKRVEVLHGPASVMYGSNALGGVMGITTWDPTDLPGGDSNRAFNMRGAYQSVDDSWAGSFVAAAVSRGHGLLAAGTIRQGHELDNQAPAEVETDPQDWDSSDVMFRYTYDSARGNRLRLSASRTERDIQTEINSLLGYGRRFRSTTAMSGDDKDTSSRVSLDYDFSAGGWQQGVIRVYDTRYETDQFTQEERTRSPRPVAIQRRFLYQQDTSGIEAFAFREFSWLNSEHRLGLGGEWSRARIDEKRDGLQTNLVTGETTSVILGEDMPVRDFPVSNTEETGLWIQDQVQLADGRWEIVPALRWDRYDLDPRPDEIWQEDNPDTEVVAVNENRTTPRLGVIYHAGRGWSVYGQYSEGFRAPPFEDANIGFDIPLFGFRAIPNPDLRSETSKGYEMGLRRFFQHGRLSLAVFRTDYDDFIESRALIGIDPATGDLLFQSRNIEEATIRGLDLRYDQDLAAWSARLAGWSLSIAAWWAEGDNLQTDQPLNSIAPPQAVGGLNWTSSSTAWDVALTGTFTAAKKESDIDQSVEDRFAPPSWFTLDLSAGWRPNEWIELRAGLFNVFDETYWRWLDVSNLEADNPMIPVLSRPGRNLSASARFNF